MIVSPGNDVFKDAERYRWLRDTFSKAVAGALHVNDERLYYEQPPEGQEVRLQWYPDTPVGFYLVHGSTLDEAIDKAMGGYRE